MEWVLDLVLVGGCLFIFYFNRGRRPAWALPAAIACVAVGALVFLVEVTGKRVKTPDKPLPSAEEVRASFESSAVTATGDVITATAFRSRFLRATATQNCRIR